MPLWDDTSTPPKSLKGKQKRNVVKTPIGWIRAGERDGTVGEKLIIVANTTSFATSSITDMWFANSDNTQELAAALNQPLNIFVSFDQPIQSLGAGVKLAVANTSGGSVGVAKSAIGTTAVVEGNKLKFTFTPSVAGTYKVQAQTMANGSTGSLSLRTTTGNGNTAISLVVSGTQSNTTGTIVVS